MAGHVGGDAEYPGDESLAAAAWVYAEKKTLIAREQDPEARAVWWQEMTTIDPSQVIFLDETSTPTTMTPLRARSRRGTRVIGRVPRGRWSAVTLLATLTPTGLGPGVQVEGAVDRHIFDTFAATTLVPTLHPGQVVVLDNLSVHKSAHARHLIEAAGCRLVFLPTYSPDFNPIEHAFAKLKLLLRQTEARSITTIMEATHAAYPRITASDARGYDRSAGYNLGNPL